MNKKKLGIYFGINSLNMVQTQKKECLFCFSAPHSLFDNTQQPSIQNIDDDIKLAAIIQRCLRDHEVQNQDVLLALPSHEIILRSFYIPWMTSSEVKGVVEFEVRRYIPFKLDELLFSYHTQTVKENKNRRIRILFIAVRKEIVRKYRELIEQSGLDVGFIEPAPIGLLRLLRSKKIIQPKKTSAVLQLNNLFGSLMIIDSESPQFIRDFKLSSDQSSLSADQAALKTNLINEIRISLDYYRRQHSQAKVDEILFLTDDINQSRTGDLETALGVKTTAVSSQGLFESKQGIDLGCLQAMGITLRQEIPLPFKVDLSERERRPKKKEAPVEWAPVDFQLTIKIAVACAVLLGIFYSWQNRELNEVRKRKQSIIQQITPLEALKIRDIQSKQIELERKINGYKSVPVKTHTAFYLNMIPQLLPKGAWLNNMKIEMREKRARSQTDQNANIISPVVSLQGQVYDKNSSRQVEVINEFVDSLRRNKEFSAEFDNIVLVSVRKNQEDDIVSTHFEIRCE